jgi:nucleotide-binding universal stress UspA family protein
MYSRIMLTLDRSPLAEQALPHAVALAQAFRAHLDVLAVVPLGAPDASGKYALHADWDAEAAESREYLAGVVSRLKDEGLQVTSEVARGNVAEEILRHAADSEADLLVMSTHGRSGLGRWVYGSIADRVLRHAPVPVLLVRATEP